jgi:peptidylprolyl isomerase
MERDERGPEDEQPAEPTAAETPPPEPEQEPTAPQEREERGPEEELPAEPTAADTSPPQPEVEPVASSWTDQPDYYAVLGVPPGSDRRIIAEAYDRLSRELQPDENAPPTDPERMRQIDEAFDFLDSDRRAEYDRARGIERLKAPRRRPLDRGTLLAGGLMLGGLAAIVAAGVVLGLALLDDGVSCSAGDGQILTTANGVEYEDLLVCDGPTLNVGDTVEANYIGTLEDGTQFVNTYELGEVHTFTFGRGQVINGWDEGLVGMAAGGKRRVKIPAEVYGEENVSADVIPPGSTLIFEIEIEDRIPPGAGATSTPALSTPEPTPPLPTQEPTTAPAAPPEVTGEEVTTDSGLKYIDIVIGSGDEVATGDAVIVNYTGWFADGGKKFDSSLERSQPLSFVLGTGSVIDGWDEGVASMKIGGKRRLIIPPELGYGEAGSPPIIPPNATLIFDVELVGVR